MLSQNEFWSKIFRICDQPQGNDDYQNSFSYNSFESIYSDMRIEYYVLAHLKQSLGFYYKRKMWCYPQNCKHFNKRRKMAMDQELILK